jgi:RNA methyltransferase, TrmH family
MLDLRSHCTPYSRIVRISPQNPLLKDVRKACRKGTLAKGDLVLAEGPHLIEEALRSGSEIDAVFVAESKIGIHAIPDGLRVFELPDVDFAELISTENSQGILALVHVPQWTLEHMLGDHALVAILDGVQDPGNAGTILRSAEAFGATGVLFRKGTVDPYNPKCVRASAGSILRLPILRSDELPDYPLFAADARAPRLLSQVDLRVACAIILGSEGHGISPDLAARATPLRIPTQGVESLNAAVAAGVIFYEAHRQRAGL